MQFKTILVPVDGSEPSQRAYQTAVQMAKDDESVTLHVLRVVPADDLPMWLDDSSFMGVMQYRMYDAAAYKEVMDQLEEKARQELLDKAAGETPDLGDRMIVRAVTRQSVASGIVEYVEENNIHLVVMGSRGLGGVRSILGSVSYSVLHQLEIPVMIVK